MAFSKTSVKYKPLRIGFLVRAGHLEDLQTAAGINSLLWGGVYNPIIPVTEDGNAFAERLIDLFSVDVLYAVAPSAHIESLKGKYPFLRDPGHYASEIFYEDWHTKKQVIGFLDVKNAIDLFWDKEFKTKARDYKSNFMLLRWDDADPLAHVFSLQFGFFPTAPDLKWNYEKLFLKGLYAQEQKISVGDNLALDPRKRFGPIDLTGVELNGYDAGFRFRGNGIFVGDSNNFDDLLTFWNLRASDLSLVFLARDHSDRVLPFAQAFVDFLNSLPNRHPEIDDWLTIYHRVDDQDAMTSIRNRLTSKKQLGLHHVGTTSWNGLNIQPPYQVFKWQSATTHIESAYDKYAVNVELPEKTFLVNSDDIEISHQQLGVIIDPYGDFGYPGYTLKLPRIAALNEFYSREIAVDPFALRVGQEGFSKIISVNDDSLTLYPISKQVLIEKLFELAGIKAETSQPGLIARKVIEKLGDIEDARVFKIRGVRRIVQEAGPGSSLTRGEATKAIYDDNFEKYKALYIEAREKGHLDSQVVFDYLLKKDVFRAGLELRCAQCRLKSWLTLKNVDDFWTCEYCGGQNRTSMQLKDRGDWRFRKSGLFAKDNNQEGAIPVLLTLLTLNRVGDHSNFTYSTAMELRGEDVKCETDLVVLQYGRRDEMGIAIGECKSQGGSITQDDCDKLKRAANRLATLGGKTKIYVLFAKTSDSFLADEIALFKELAKDVNLILFTNRELEPFHPYWLEGGGIEDDIPEKYPHSLSDLARNSHARYLN